MSDAALVTANPAPPPVKRRQGRSPAFPFVAMDKALQRAETVRVAEGGRPRHFTPLPAVCAAWKMGVKTGPAIQTVAALGHYGLFEFQGSGDRREARLTALALQILLDKQPISSERDQLVSQLALRPAIHAELWQKWEAALPSDATLQTYLVRDRGFSESGARDLIAQYKDTIAFAKLGQPAIIAPASQEQKPEGDKIEIGDLIQIEVDGALAFEAPARVRAVQEHDGRTWVFIEGSEAGILMEQTILEQKGKTDLAPPLIPPRLPEKTIETPQPGTRREVFALDEGDVVVTFPDVLSAESFSDLKAYLDVFIKKMRRRTGAVSGDGAAPIDE